MVSRQVAVASPGGGGGAMPTLYYFSNRQVLRNIRFWVSICCVCVLFVRDLISSPTVVPGTQKRTAGRGQFVWMYRALARFVIVDPFTPWMIHGLCAWSSLCTGLLTFSPPQGAVVSSCGSFFWGGPHSCSLIFLLKHQGLRNYRFWMTLDCLASLTTIATLVVECIESYLIRT